MSKDTKRRIYDAKRALIVKELAAYFQKEPDTIRKALRRELKSALEDEIRREYNVRYEKLKQALNS